MWTVQEPGALRAKDSESLQAEEGYGIVTGGRDPNSGRRSGSSTVTVLLRMYLRVRKFRAEESITRMDHPPYSFKLAPCHVWLYPEFKITPTEQIFADISDIQHNMVLSRAIPRTAHKNVSGGGTIVSRREYPH
jgi:hypothetical protein